MEDTLNTDNDALIAAMLETAEKTTLPGELDNPVIHRGDADTPPMVGRVASGPDYVWIYNHEGERVRCLLNMAPQKLRQRMPDGKHRFTLADPGVRPFKGTVKCMLHPDSPDRPHYKALGFRECLKHNIANHHQLTEHMRKRHKQEWAAIEAEKKETERQEDREFQKAIMMNRQPSPSASPAKRKVTKKTK